MLELPQWEAFLLAVVGAAAVLTGLMFVGVSINLERVLQGPGVIPARAAETLGTLVLAIITGSLALLPQSAVALGVEVVVLTTLLLFATTRSQIRHHRNYRDAPSSWLLTRSISTLSCCIPSLVGGIFLLVDDPNGIYGIAVAALLAVSGCVYNAWVLLIEIAR
ncbi:hypothetical protein [Agreia sp.]|uniref:hypothetical protein n=1 Tax=Agreia sp. TaxID=1872416 RepID=UPI0035BC85B4